MGRDTSSSMKRQYALSGALCWLALALMSCGMLVGAEEEPHAAVLLPHADGIGIEPAQQLDGHIAELETALAGSKAKTAEIETALAVKKKAQSPAKKLGEANSGWPLDFKFTCATKGSGCKSSHRRRRGISSPQYRRREGCGQACKMITETDIYSDAG